MNHKTSKGYEIRYGRTAWIAKRKADAEALRDDACVSIFELWQPPEILCDLGGRARICVYCEPTAEGLVWGYGWLRPEGVESHLRVRGVWQASPGTSRDDVIRAARRHLAQDCFDADAPLATLALLEFDEDRDEHLDWAAWQLCYRDAKRQRPDAGDEAFRTYADEHQHAKARALRARQGGR